jgi:hypothetical protein
MVTQENTVRNVGYFVLLPRDTEIVLKYIAPNAVPEFCNPCLICCPLYVIKINLKRRPYSATSQAPGHR